MGIPREPGPSKEGQDEEGGGPPYGDENDDNRRMNSFRAPTRSSCGGESNAYMFVNSMSSDTKSNCRSHEQDVNKTFVEPVCPWSTGQEPVHGRLKDDERTCSSITLRKTQK